MSGMRKYRSAVAITDQEVIALRTTEALDVHLRRQLAIQLAENLILDWWESVQIERVPSDQATYYTLSLEVMTEGRLERYVQQRLIEAQEVKWPR